MYTWGGVERLIVVFSDSLQAGGSLHFGNGEGVIDHMEAARMMAFLTNHSFAGATESPSCMTVMLH